MTEKMRGLQRVRTALLDNDAVRVTVAGSSGQHSLGSVLAVGQWKARWPAGGDAARRRYVVWLQTAFDALAREFPGRVKYGWLERSQASTTHYLVWGANVANVHGSPGDSLAWWGGQAAAMGTHGEGVFGIVTTPVAGVPAA